MDDQQRARELLAQEYERDGITHVPDCIRREAMLTEIEHRAVRAITAALRATPDGFVLVPVDSVLPCGCGCYRVCCRSCGTELGGFGAARPQGVK